MRGPLSVDSVVNGQLGSWARSSIDRLVEERVGGMTPYEIFVEAVKEDPTKTFRDAWSDFAVWEIARGYSDDPSATSKDALEWIRALDELAERLEEFEGAALEGCHNALEAAFVAFARLDHSDELCSAIRRWREWRLAEKVEQSEG